MSRTRRDSDIAVDGSADYSLESMFIERKPVNRQLNVVVVICHDLGQHLGCYGQPDVRSPNIDSFAASGVRFENSFCTAPQCSPSRAALWTGRFAHANGVVGLVHGGFANDFHADERHLVQLLRGAGYDTHLFGIQHESRSPERCGYEYIHRGRNCVKLADDFAEFMRSRSKTERSLFAQVGFFEPHRPFPREDDVMPLPHDSLTVPPYLPDIPEVREDLTDIEASIASMDRAFGHILEAIRASDVADNTVVLFTADHGIAFPHAKMTLYDPGIEVPLILSGSGLKSGVVRTELISNVDVMPTLLEMLKCPCPENLHGRSFFRLLSDGEYTPNDAVFAEKTYHGYYDPMRAVRTERLKLIANFEFTAWQETSPDYDNNAKSYVEISKALNISPDARYHAPFELYDLEEDPNEQVNLADTQGFQEIRDDLICVLFRWMTDTDDPLLEGPMAQGAYRQRMKQFTKIGQSGVVHLSP